LLQHFNYADNLKTEEEKTMTDTTVLNRIFQIQFDTKLDLADLIHFINHRMEVLEVFPELTAEEATLLTLDMGIEPMQMFDAQEMLTAIQDEIEPIDICQQLIQEKDMEAITLFTVEEMFFNIDDQQLIDEANDRGLSLG
jgi:hypothetical protein